MQILDIATDLRPGATPAHVEALIRGVRVATDVARGAETLRIRRAVGERMKYPTDDELRNALERLPLGDELGPRYRAQRQLDARDLMWREGRRFPPDLWFEYFYRRGPADKGSRLFVTLAAAGYDRLAATPFPFFGTVGLDVVDPVLYDALVADEVTRALPDEIGVRTLQYDNPFLARIFGKGTAEKAVSTTVEVIETARDFGPKRKMAKADAAVAEATIDNRVAESDLDVALKRERVIEARLLNERLALENARLQDALGADQQQRRLIDQALHRGQLDIADAIQALDPTDAQALGELGRRPLELDESWELDEPNE